VKERKGTHSSSFLPFREGGRAREEFFVLRLPGESPRRGDGSINLPYSLFAALRPRRRREKEEKCTDLFLVERGGRLSLRLLPLARRGGRGKKRGLNPLLPTC